jgi:hypothetical protein
MPDIAPVLIFRIHIYVPLVMWAHRCAPDLILRGRWDMAGAPVDAKA